MIQNCNFQLEKNKHLQDQRGRILLPERKQREARQTLHLYRTVADPLGCCHLLGFTTAGRATADFTGSRDLTVNQ